MNTIFRLIGLENDHPVTKASDRNFLVLIQRAVLLALKDAGTLNEMQHRQAEEELLRQYTDGIRAAHAEAEEND